MTQPNPDAGQGASAGTDSGAQGGAATGTGTATETATPPETGQGTGATTEDAKVDRADFERIQRQLSAADQKRQEAENRLKELDDANKSELEKATERAKSLEADLAKTKEQVQALLLEKAMLVDGEFGAARWWDPEEPLARLHKAVKDGNITVDEQGAPNAKEIKKFLKDLAESRKYLLKTEAEGNGNPPKSGEAVGAGARGSGNQAERDADLKKRYRIV